MAPCRRVIVIRANRRTSFASYMRRGSTSLAAFACRLRVRIDLLRLPAPSPRRAHGSSRSTAMREDERPLTIPVLIALHFRLRLCYSDPKCRPSAALGPRYCLLDEPDLGWACEARGLGTRARAGAARAFGRARHLALRAGFREGVWATPQCVLRCAALHADAALRCMSPTSVGMRSTVALCV